MERLQKVIAHAGITSRRKAEEYILQGRVKVNGAVVTELGVQVGKNDRVEVDGVPITQENYVYYLLNKPRGYISSVSDDKERKVVTDLITDETRRIYPVGRLDYDTTGLLLLTNDGELANLLTHPKYEIDKVYVAKVKGIATKPALMPLTRGVKIEGKKTSPARFEIISTDSKTGTSIVQLTIHEGRNHQVKNMLQAVGFPVQKLKREQYGPLTLKGVQTGQFRELSHKEINQLKEQVK